MTMPIESYVDGILFKLGSYFACQTIEMLLVNNLLSNEQCKGTKDHNIVHNPPMLFLSELLYFF